MHTKAGEGLFSIWKMAVALAAACPPPARPPGDDDKSKMGFFCIHAGFAYINDHASTSFLI